MICSIISYCTHDFRFIGKCIEEARHFSHRILIPVSDCFFDGNAENRDLLDATYALYPDCEFLEFSYTPHRLYSHLPTYIESDPEWVKMWHQTARYIGYMHATEKDPFLLFLDCDEIPDGKRVSTWLKSGEYERYNAMRLLGYYYAIRPTLRAKKLHNVALLVKREALLPRFFFHPDERYALFRYVEEPKAYDVRGEDRIPLFHHYSWVRPMQEALQKAARWGHRDERDWAQEIQACFSGAKNIGLFGQPDLEFEEIERAFFDPLGVELPQGGQVSSFPHVKKVTPRTLFSMELEREYGM